MQKGIKYFILILIVCSGTVLFSGCSLFKNNKDLQTYFSYFSDHKKDLNNCCNECFGLQTLVYPDMSNYWESSCSEFKGLSGGCKSFFDKYYPIDSYGECISKSPDLEKSAKLSFLKGMKEKYGNKKWVGRIDGRCWSRKSMREMESKVGSPHILEPYKEPESSMTIQEMKIDFDSWEKQGDFLGDVSIPVVGSAFASITPSFTKILDDSTVTGDILETPINTPVPFDFVGEIYQYGAADGLAFNFHPINDYEGRLMIKQKTTVYLPPPTSTLTKTIKGWINDLNWLCPMTMIITVQGDGLMEKININYEKDEEKAIGELDLQ